MAVSRKVVDMLSFMLHFEIPPDTVFLDMLDDAIAQMIDEMDLEEPIDQGESFAVYAPQQSILHATTGKRAAVQTHCVP